MKFNFLIGPMLFITSILSCFLYISGYMGGHIETLIEYREIKTRLWYNGDIVWSKYSDFTYSACDTIVKNEAEANKVLSILKSCN